MKHLFYTLISVSLGLWICASTASAQVKIVWDKTIGGNSLDDLRNVVSTPDGGYLVSGFSFSDRSGDKSEDTKGNLDNDYWIVKIDGQGNKQWDKSFGGKNFENHYSTISSLDGGYLLGGTSNSPVSGDKSEANRGEEDYWIVKIDANGNKQWDKTFGGSSGDNLLSMVATPDGGYLLGGFSWSDASGDKSQDSKGLLDYWIVKIDGQGNLLWDKTIGGDKDDYLSSITLAADRGFLLAGYSHSGISGDKSENSQGQTDFWVVKIDDQGNTLWDKAYGGNNFDQVPYIISAEVGYLLAGSSDSDPSGDKSEAKRGDSDYWIIKIDEKGNKLWDKTFGGTKSEELHSAIYTPNGELLLAGYSYSDVSGDKTENSNGERDFWLIKVDSKGNKLWDKTIGGNNFDDLSSIILNSEGGYILGGYSDSPVSGNKSEDNIGGFDYWILELREYNTPLSHVSNLTLINTQTEKDIQKLKEGDVVNLDTIACSLLSIRANTTPDQVDSVHFALTGPFIHQYTDHTLPYTLFGDHQGDYKGKKWLPGDYKLKVTPSIEGQTGTILTMSFKIVENANTNHLIAWEKSFGGSVHDYLISTISTPDGGYLLGGDSDSPASGDKSEDNKGVLDYVDYDFWIVKTDELGNKMWDRTFGGDDNDELNKIIPTSDGGYLLAGQSKSPISEDKSENPKGGCELACYYDFWILKIDAQGNKVWDKTLGGNRNESLGNVISTPDGGYLILGSSYSDASGDKSEGNNGLSWTIDAWIIKIDDQGNKIWDKTLGGAGDDNLNKVILTSDGSYVLAGYFQGISRDYWVVKIDEQGNLLWNKTFEGDQFDNFQNLLPTSDGGFLLAGTSNSNASSDKSEDSKGEEDYWVVRIDAQGNKLWDKTLGGNASDNFQSLISTADGGFLLAGQSVSSVSGDKSEGNKGERDAWIIKMDDQGNKVWDKTLGGNKDDYLLHVFLTADGGYFLAGSSNSDESGDKSEDSKGYSDYWVVKIDEIGQKLWDKTIGGNESDFLKRVIVTIDGNYLLAGDTQSDASGDKSEGNNGVYDYWIVKLEGEDSIDADTRVASLTLVNVQTDEDIQELKEGDVINLAEVNCSLLSIRANTTPSTVDSVHFALSGPFSYQRMERKAPYALFSDEKGDYYGKKLKAGEYTLTVTPYLQGQAGTVFTLSFEVTDAFQVTRFKLIDATLDKAVCELKDGAVIDLASFKDHLLTFRAYTQPLHLDQVVFELEGPMPQSTTDTDHPFTLFGEQAVDSAVDYLGVQWLTGSYTLTATPYLQGRMGIPYSISFRIKDSSCPDPNEHALKVQVYPIPTTGVILIAHEGEIEQTELRLLDGRGKMLLRQPLSSLPHQQWDLSAYKKGIYYLKVISPTKVKVIRIVLDY